ncbi:hypothetical protein [Thermus thalpophilus]|uniref:hypothetical protein n=1 Tax=Thermus thalpophilus TaxID=2908147 RepID=UPI001FAA2E4E|nr:hypothetical protein [Thermus thalpophilus]
MEVVLRHVIGYFLRELSLGSPEWLLLAAVNRTLHFAVPAFLFMTALVLGAGLLRGVRLGRWVRNPALRLLWPHLLFRYWDAGVFQPERLFHRLLRGKAYFLAVTLQLTLLPPFAFPSSGGAPRASFSSPGRGAYPPRLLPEPAVPLPGLPGKLRPLVHPGHIPRALPRRPPGPPPPPAWGAAARLPGATPSGLVGLSKRRPGKGPPGGWPLSSGPWTSPSRWPSSGEATRRP